MKQRLLKPASPETRAQSSVSAPASEPADEDALERLRRQVHRAVAVIERLRAQNRALATRVRELEENPAIDHDGTVLTLQEEPEDLREQINTFIEAIDEHLAEERPDA